MEEEPLPRHTLVLRLTDRPGAMELIAATFAHRGVSLQWAVGNDGASSPEGHAIVIVHFAATHSRKESLQRTLSRLSPVVSASEPAASGRAVRTSALVQLSIAAYPIPAMPSVHAELLIRDPATGSLIYSLMGPPDAVYEMIEGFRQQRQLIAVTQTILAL